MNRAAALMAIILACALPAFAQADQNIVVAKTAPDAVLLWDATDQVASAVKSHQSRDQALTGLELEAVRILLLRSPRLQHSKNVEVRVIYARTGAVSPVYGTPDFVSFERLMTVRAARTTLLRNGARLSASVAKGRVPNDISISLTGKLPPPS